MSSEHGLDRLARELASGEISRRAALRRMAGAAIGVGLASVPGASAFASAGSKRCPPSRRCGEKCCPKHARCKRGRCKCDSGYTKCGKKCVDLETDVSNCGDCATVCDPGRACVGGECQNCSIADECPQPSDDCQIATCDQGFCGMEPRDDGSACNDGNACTTGETCTDGVCGGGTPVSIDDGFACTTDACDPETGEITHTPNDSLCDDGNVCTTDVCDPQQGGCVSSPVPDDTACGAGKACCGGHCVNLGTRLNCAACGDECAFMLEVCHNGFCE